MMGLFGRKESQTSNLQKMNLREWDTERLWDTREGKADYYDKVKELRDDPERWKDGQTYETHDDRLAALQHGLTLIEDELIRRGEMHSPGKGAYRSMT